MVVDLTDVLILREHDLRDDCAAIPDPQTFARSVPEVLWAPDIHNSTLRPYTEKAEVLRTRRHDATHLQADIPALPRSPRVQWRALLGPYQL